MVRPRQVNLSGILDSGRKLVKKVQIIPGDNVDLRITKIRSEITKEVQYRLDSGKNKGEYLLTVENIRTLPGRYHGKIIIETNLSRKPELVLNIYGNIRSKIEKPGSVRGETKTGRPQPEDKR